MFEIISVIVGIYVIIKINAIVKSIDDENARYNEKINDGWIDYRTHNAFRA